MSAGVFEFSYLLLDGDYPNKTMLGEAVSQYPELEDNLRAADSRSPRQGWKHEPLKATEDQFAGLRRESHGIR